MGRLGIEEASWFSFMQLCALIMLLGPEFSTVISAFVLNNFLIIVFIIEQISRLLKQYVIFIAVMLFLK